METYGYKYRQHFEMENWPELREAMNNTFKLKQFVFTAESQGSVRDMSRNNGKTTL